VLGKLSLALMLRLALVSGLMAVVRILGHDVLKVAPERLDGRKFRADLSDFLQRTVQLVDVLQHKLKALERH
jgi:hypothetical protein